MKVPTLYRKFGQVTDIVTPSTAALLRLGLPAFALNALLVVVAALVLVYLATDPQDRLRQRLEAFDLDAHRATVTTTVAQYAAIAERIASSRSAIRTVSGGNPARIRGLENELAGLIPDGVRVRLLAADVTTLKADSHSRPPLSYAGLDLLHRSASETAPTAAEVHLYGTPDAHFSIVRRILSAGGEATGLVMVNTALAPLERALRSLPPAGGYIELRQNGAGPKPLVLIAAGDGAVRTERPVATAEVDGSRWHLAYWPPASGYIPDTDSTFLSLTVVLVAILLLGVVHGWWLTRIASIVRDDLESLTRLVRDLFQGHPKAAYPAALPHTENTIEALRTLALQRATRVAATIEPKRTSQQVTRAEPSPFSPNTEGMQVEVREDPDESDGISPSIFRAYDIRGIVDDTLTDDVVHLLGRAIGSLAAERDIYRMAIARDARQSSAQLLDSLAKGLQKTGIDVVDIGVVPTPILYFATHDIAGVDSGVMVTGSHNPPEYNGLKIVIEGRALHGDDIRALQDRVEKREFREGKGHLENADFLPDYVERITGDVHIARPLTVVADCGNGVAGKVVPGLLTQLGCHVVELFCEPDGSFPNHPPDPGNPENLATLIETVRAEQADIGLAFDGDGDRLVAVDSSGEIVWPDQLLMLFASDLLARQPGTDIIFDVKCSRHLPRVIAEYGGNPHMWKTGYSVLKARMQETGALLAGEYSGHIMFGERWYGFDDGIYASARLLEILGFDPRSSHEVFSEFPHSVSTPELQIPLPEGQAHRIVEQLLTISTFTDAKVTTLDGLRVDFEDGWALVRASNTTPYLLLRFEADDDLSMARVQEEIRTVLLQADPNLKIPF